jgi:hypothetical protein
MTIILYYPFDKPDKNLDKRLFYHRKWDKMESLFYPYQSISIRYILHENFIERKSRLMFVAVTDELLYSAQI